MRRLPPHCPLGRELCTHRTADWRRSRRASIAQSGSRYLGRLRDDPSSHARRFDEARRRSRCRGIPDSRQDQMVRRVLCHQSVRFSAVPVRSQRGLRHPGAPAAAVWLRELRHTEPLAEADSVEHQEGEGSVRQGPSAPSDSTLHSAFGERFVATTRLATSSASNRITERHP